MPTIRVFNKNKVNTLSEYEFGDETLELFIKKYDNTASPDIYRVVVGDHIFKK